MWPFTKPKPNPEPRFPEDFAAALPTKLDGATSEVAIPFAAKTAPESAPYFRRIYTTNINRIKLDVTARSWSFQRHRDFSGCLTQPNGNWVLFDPDRIAEKILDPTLVPLIAKAVELAKALDAEFVREGMVEFVDEKGVTWRRTDAPLMLAGVR